MPPLPCAVHCFCDLPRVMRRSRTKGSRLRAIFTRCDAGGDEEPSRRESGMRGAIQEPSSSCTWLCNLYIFVQNLPPLSPSNPSGCDTRLAYVFNLRKLHQPSMDRIERVAICACCGSLACSCKTNLQHLTNKHKPNRIQPFTNLYAASKTNACTTLPSKKMQSLNTRQNGRQE
jgi:hypothetical protein